MMVRRSMVIGEARLRSAGFAARRCRGSELGCGILGDFQAPLCCSPCLSIFMYSAPLGVTLLASNIILKYISVYDQISYTF